MPLQKDFFQDKIAGRKVIRCMSEGRRIAVELAYGNDNAGFDPKLPVIIQFIESNFESTPDAALPNRRKKIACQLKSIRKTREKLQGGDRL